ncbi:hypothetical protein BS78_03G120300 [Paspalum vaginatum]|nr:hypothetical protein BS78_03G120300 [Paspalum vaginatum]
MGDHYQTLGIRRDATKAEVKAAFRRHALRDHPDRHAGTTDAAASADAARRFRQASDAYHVLSDDRRRAEYDFRLRGSTSSYARTSSSGWGASSSSASYGYGYGYGHGGGSWRRTPPGAGAGASAGSIDWELLLKAVTRRGFLINLGFASVMLSGATFLDGSILEIWKINNSGKSFEDAMEKVRKTEKGDT